MLNKIITWAQKEDAIRALVLTGFRASNNATDFLADSWKALMAQAVAVQAAENLGYQYPTDVDENITEFVQKVRFEKD